MSDDKLPRGHAYIRMRNGGCRLDIDYPEVDSADAERIIAAVISIFRECLWNGTTAQYDVQIPVDGGAKEL